jgi:putative transposase
LTIHADRGAIMLAKSVYQLYTDLGVQPSHSRPHTSDDNPFSEAAFKTVKYHPTYPATFDAESHARRHFRDFFRWYNAEHRHSGISLLTPESLHYGFAPLVIERRQVVLDTAYAAHPERFVRRRPAPAPLPTAVWINPL